LAIHPAAATEAPFTTAEFATFHVWLTGAQADAAVTAAIGDAGLNEWIGAARSIEAAEDTWHGLFLGGKNFKLLGSAGLAAKRRLLTPRILAVEANPAVFSTLHSAMERRGFTAAEARLLQAEVSATVAESPPRAAAVEALLAEAPRCDLLHISVPGVTGALLDHALDLLGSRVRWLVILTRTRGEEQQAITRLGSRGWQLLADHPCAVALPAPNTLVRHGTQVWRGPLA